MAHTSSHDYSQSEVLDLGTGHTSGQDSQSANRRVSWDDFSLFYQTSQDWDYAAANKSQNPSPKLGSKMLMESIDISAISPLSQSIRDMAAAAANDSETDDCDSS